MRGVGGVGAVGDHHQPGERQAGQLVARALERLARGASPCRRISDRPPTPTRSADDEKLKKRSDEALRQRVEQRAFGPVELLLDERAARLAVAIGDRHAARIVDEHAEEILLRDRGLEDQRRPEQAEEQDGERGERAAPTSTTRSRGRSRRRRRRDR